MSDNETVLGPCSSSPSRSAVPDLLFDDVRDARVADLDPLLDDPHHVAATTRLHRVTVFVTYRCNLSCSYCKTIVRTPGELLERPQRAETFDLLRFDAMLAEHGATPIDHLHFTGGEASLSRELPAMVRRAKERGVGCVSITSNGTLAPSAYVRLIEAGIDEVRISIDEAHAALGQGDTHEPSGQGRALATVRALGALRAAGLPFFLILNTVVEPRRCADLPALVRFLLSLGADDLKLITSVDDKEALGAFEGRAEVVAELERLLATYPLDRFPLLRRKVRTVFSAETIGLETVRAPANGDWRCYIPLTERTVDGRYYYPCSVYLREGGAPLGALDEASDEQRRKTADFVARGDCLTDPICARYCLHCTREFNVAANEARTPTASARPRS
ncbi:MAG: radical SAM protein [Planctomycetota bacterium]